MGILETRPRLVVIDPALYSPETDCFNELARFSKIPMTYHLPGLYGFGSMHRETAEDRKKIAGIILLGSAASVYDNQPWQQELENWLLPLMNAGIPTLGVCYGHQMLARMFGGSVDYITEDRVKLVGFHKVHFVKSRLWKEGDRRLVRSHREFVSKCPADFSIIGSSDEIGVDAIEHKNLPIWGIQPHPEATNEFLKAHQIEEQTDPAAAFLDGFTMMRDFIDFATQHAKQ